MESPDLPSMRQDGISVKKVKEFDWSKYKPPRAGVVVYTVHNGKTLLGFGVDSQYGTLTDFGGGVKYREDVTALRGGLRELREESLGVFGDISPEEVGKYIAVASPQLVTIFIHLSVDPEDICMRFDERAISRGPRVPTEVKKITWIPLENYRSLLEDKLGEHVLYDKVKELLLQALDGGDYTMEI